MCACACESSLRIIFFTSQICLALDFYRQYFGTSPRLTDVNLKFETQDSEEIFQKLWAWEQHRTDWADLMCSEKVCNLEALKYTQDCVFVLQMSFVFYFREYFALNLVSLKAMLCVFSRNLNLTCKYEIAYNILLRYSKVLSTHARTETLEFRVVGWNWDLFRVLFTRR